MDQKLLDAVNGIKVAGYAWLDVTTAWNYVPPVVPPPAVTVPPLPPLPVIAEVAFTGLYPAVYYSSSTGDDKNPGTQALPKKTVKLSNNQTAYLKRGDTFGKLDASGLMNVQVSCYGDTNLPYPRIYIATSNDVVLKTWTNSTNIQFDRLWLDSAFSMVDKGDGKPFKSGTSIGCRIRGKNLIFSNIRLGTLAVGLSADAATGTLIMRNIRQDDPNAIAGQGIILLSFETIDIDGVVLLNSPNESPFRMSLPGGKAGSIKNMILYQNTDGKLHTSGKACAAIHCVTNVVFTNIYCDGQNFSLNTAGEAPTEKVSACVFNNITVNGGILQLNNAVNCTFVSPYTVSGGQTPLNLTGTNGNLIHGGTFITTLAHIAHAFAATDTIITNCTGYSSNAACVFIDGVTTAKNNPTTAGNSVVKVAA